MAASPTELDVLSFGEALVDFFPERPGIPLAECDRFERHLGGAPCNLAVGLARQGARVGLLTLVGPDDFGTFVRRRLGEEGVCVRALGTHPSAKTGVTFVAVGASGQRSFLFFRHPSADQLIASEHVDRAEVARARVVHFGSSTLAREPARSATFKALAAAREAGRVISTDPNWRPHLWENPQDAPPILKRLLESADIVKISDDELEPLLGVRDIQAGAHRLRELGAQVVVVTLGERGCYYQAAAGSGSLPAERVEVVDTTGAGDAFMAGLLAELAPRLAGGKHSLAALGREELERACARGNHLGALAVTKMGATTGLPRAR